MESANIDNGRMGQADFKFYKGKVGIRDLGETWEVAYFGPNPNVQLPTDGRIDGDRVRVTAVRVRDLGQLTQSTGRGNAIRSITLVVEPR